MAHQVEADTIDRVKESCHECSLLLWTESVERGHSRVGDLGQIEQVFVTYSEGHFVQQHQTHQLSACDQQQCL